MPHFTVIEGGKSGKKRKNPLKRPRMKAGETTGTRNTWNGATRTVTQMERRKSTVNPYAVGGIAAAGGAAYLGIKHHQQIADRSKAYFDSRANHKTNLRTDSTYAAAQYSKHSRRRNIGRGVATAGLAATFYPLPPDKRQANFKNAGAAGARVLGGAGIALVGSRYARHQSRKMRQIQNLSPGYTDYTRRQNGKTIKVHRKKARRS